MFVLCRLYSAEIRVFFQGKNRKRNETLDRPWQITRTTAIETVNVPDETTREEKPRVKKKRKKKPHEDLL